MIKKGGHRDERTEELIDLLEGALREEGYQTIRMSDTSCICGGYDCIIVKDWKFPGGIITLGVDNRGNEFLKYLFERKEE